MSDYGALCFDRRSQLPFLPGGHILEMKSILIQLNLSLYSPKLLLSSAIIWNFHSPLNLSNPGNLPRIGSVCCFCRRFVARCAFVS